MAANTLSQQPLYDPNYGSHVSCEVWPPNSPWWQEFSKHTDDGKRPYVFKGVLPADFPMADEVDRVLRSMAFAAAERRRLRIYLGSERRDDLASQALAHPFEPDTPTFDQICERVSASRVGFMINDLQDWSDPWTRAIGTFLESMFIERGMPPGGAEQILFAGDYSGTAFGAHRGFEHAFLFHVGPGCKEFHLWSEAEFEALTGALTDVIDYEPLLPFAHTVLLEPGDVLYLPALWFHIGTQRTYSASIAVGLYDYPISRWLRLAFEELSAVLPHDGEPTSYLRPSLVENPFAQLAQPMVEELIHQRLSQRLDDHWFKRCSNAGFVCADETLRAPLALGLDSRVRTTAPFKICWNETSPGVLSVYLRHRRLQMKAVDEIPRLLERLNTGSYCLVQELCAELAERFSNEAVLGILSALTRTGGLELAT